MYPEVVGVVSIWQTEWEAATFTDHVFKALFIYSIHVEWRVSEHEVKLAGGCVRIVLVAVDVAAVTDLALKPMHCKVESCEATSFVGLFNTADRQLGGWVLVVLSNETC